jgi:microcystin-dependent protein
MSSGIPGMGKSYPYWPANYDGNGGGGGGGGPVGSIIMWATPQIPQYYKLCNGQSLLISQYSSLYNAIGNTFSSGKATPGGIYCQTYEICGNEVILDLGPEQVNFSISAGDTVKATGFTKSSGNYNINGYSFLVTQAPPIGNVSGIIRLFTGPDLSGQTGFGTIGNLTRINFNLPDFNNYNVRGAGVTNVGDVSGNDSATLIADNLPQHRHGYNLAAGSGYGAASGDNGNRADQSQNYTNSGQTYLDSSNDATTNSPFSVINRYIAMNFIIRYA